MSAVSGIYKSVVVGITSGHFDFPEQMTRCPFTVRSTSGDLQHRPGKGLQLKRSVAELGIEPKSPDTQTQ